MNQLPIEIRNAAFVWSVFLFRLQKTWRQIILTSWRIPVRLARLADGVRSASSPIRVVVAVLLMLAVVAPTVLYLHERAARRDLDRSYRYLSLSAGSEIESLKYTLGSLVDEQFMLRSFLLDEGYPVASGGELAIQLLATGYTSSIMETDSTPFTTASNTRTRPGVIALSRDLLRRYDPNAPFSFGDIVHLTGVGDCIVEDSMHPRWQRRADIWFPSRRTAREFGRQTVVLTVPLSELASRTEAAGSGSAGADLAANTASER